MILKLLRILFAVFAVVCLTGWFWSKCLCASAELVKRFVYSVALSFALVPVVAFVQVIAFHTSVTLPISIVSVVVVFVSGLVMYLAFGSAKEPEAPLISFLISLGARHGDPEHPQYREEEASSRKHPAAVLLHYGSLLAVLSLVALRSFPGLLRYDWPFPRGVDSYEHAIMTRMMLSSGSTNSFMLFPPGLHVLGALLSRLSGLDPLRLFTFVASALLLLPTLGCYVLARRLWGWGCAVAAMIRTHSMRLSESGAYR